MRAWPLQKVRTHVKTIQYACLYLFVCENQDVCLAELLVAKHLVQLLLGDAQTLAVSRVHHQDDKLLKNKDT